MDIFEKAGSGNAAETFVCTLLLCINFLECDMIR